jgi:hypothetical protein
MFNGGQGFRAFRPSRVSGIEEEQDLIELEKDKQHNIQLYADRVRAGLPLFEARRIASSPRSQIA